MYNCKFEIIDLFNNNFKTNCRDNYVCTCPTNIIRLSNY